MKISLNKISILYLSCSLFLLIFGLIGIFRLVERPKLPIHWTTQDNKIVISDFDNQELSDLQKGDILLKINGITISKIQCIEFIIDFKQIGEIATLNLKRENQIFQRELLLISRYNLGYIIILSIIGLLFWGIGLFVFLKKREEKVGRIFFWGTTILSFSLMVNWPGGSFGDSIFGFILPFSYLLVYPFFPSTFINFLLIFPQKKLRTKKYKFILFVFYFLSTCIALGLLFTYLPALMNKSINFYLRYYFVYSIFRVFLILSFIFSIGLLINSYRSSKTREELNKIRWIVWGILIGGSPFIFLWTIPYVLFNVQLIPELVTYVFLSFIPLAFAISIVRYKAFNIEIIISKTLVYSLVTGFIVILYLLLVGIAGLFLHNLSQQTNHFLIILFTLIAAILFNPLKQKIQVFVDKTFYRIRYNYKHIISDFGLKLSELANLQDITDFLLQIIQKAIPIEKIALLVKDLENGGFKLISSNGISDKEKSSFFIPGHCSVIEKMIQKKYPLVKIGASKLTDTIDLQEETEYIDLQIKVILPVFSKNKVIAILMLGSKSSGGKYIQDDIDLITALSTEALLAFERHQFFEKMILEKTERERLEEINNLKSEFVSHISHELRTPMTAIRWSVENILDGIPEKPSERMSNYLKGMRNSSLHLSYLIDNLLDMSKIESEKYSIVPTGLQLSEILEITLTSINTIAARKGIKIITNVPDDLYVLADNDSLKRILINLVDNAIKYSPENTEITINTKVNKIVEHEQNDSNNSNLIISVCDEGIGIPVEKYKTIFESFERVVNENTASIKGLGLGLHIVKNLVELNHGEIWVESDIGKGSVFSFSLPISV